VEVENACIWKVTSIGDIPHFSLNHNYGKGTPVWLNFINHQPTLTSRWNTYTTNSPTVVIYPNVPLKSPQDGGVGWPACQGGRVACGSIGGKFGTMMAMGFLGRNMLETTNRGKVTGSTGSRSIHIL